MFLAGSVAGFTGHALTLMRQREFPMRVVGELLYGLGVACFTNLRTHVIVSTGSRGFLVRSSLLFIVDSTAHTAESPHSTKQSKERNERRTQKQPSHPSLQNRGQATWG